jgi:hypothetical protein
LFPHIATTYLRTLALQPSLRGRALKQEISLPVARRLVLVRTASQLLKLPTGRGLKDSL